ncbi:MAG TPA: ribonuclease HII [Syntrophobacteraceae bacterium]|jgi:ribonuclease HII|nr:ribonuclease HII [Syntrophobacteraceae bacterium]
MSDQTTLFSPGAADRWLHERRARSRGYLRVAGIDEVGRGPLAGPVVAAAVILPPNADLLSVRDSKQLRAAQREVLDRLIHERAVDIAIGSVGPEEIDAINILQASFQAMLRAVRRLHPTPDFLLIDGPYSLPVAIPHKGIKKGDQLSVSIASASIVAKVYRDRLMVEQHHHYPVYGFDRNKGYGTRQHLEALRRHGPCPLHRRTFRGVLPQ